MVKIRMLNTLIDLICHQFDLFLELLLFLTLLSGLANKYCITLKMEQDQSDFSEDQQYDNYEQPNALIEVVQEQNQQAKKPTLKRPFTPKTQIGAKIKHYFTSEKVTQETSYSLKNIINFEKKLTNTPFCTFLLKGKTKIYKCYDCQKHENACLCEECFKNSNHEGHRFYVRQIVGGFSGVCDCGNQQIWKKSGFCCNHTGTVENIQIPTKEKEQFITVWRDIFGVCFDLISDQVPDKGLILKRQINSMINDLNANSLYYQQLSAELLNQPDFIDESKTIFQSIISTHIKFFTNEDLNLCINLYSLSQYTKKFTRSIIKCHNQFPACLDHKQYAQFFFQGLNKIEYFQQLAKEEELTIYEQKIRPSYVYNLKVMLRFDENPPVQVVKCLIRKNLIKDNIVQIFKCERVYNFPIRLVQSMLITLKNAQEKQYLGRAIKQILQYGRQDVTIGVFTMGLALYQSLESDLQTTNYKKLFNQIQVQENLLKDYLFDKMNDKIKTIMRGGNFEKQFAILFKVFDDFQWLDQYFEAFLTKFWKLQNLWDDQKLVNIVVRNAIFIIQILRIFCHRQQFELYLYDDYQIKSVKLLQRCKNSLKISFAQMEEQQISQASMQRTILNIGKQYKQQLVTFIKQNLHYDAKRQYYSYIGQKMRPHPYQSIESYKFSDKVNFLSFRDKNMLKKILTPARVSQITKFFCQIMQVQHYQQQQKMQMALRLSIQVFVAVHCFIGDSLPQHQDFLAKIRKQQIDIFHLAKGKESLAIRLRKTLEMQKYQAPKTQESTMNFKEKAAQMKKKKFDQLRKKQQKAKQLTKQLQQAFQSPVKQYKQICLLCHQEGYTENSLVSFINISKTNVLSYCFGTNTQEIDIRGCEHKVHQSCFLKSFGNSQYFQCPLCKGVFNSIIPCDFDQQSIKKGSCWMGRIEFILAMNWQNSNYSVFQLLLRFFVYSKAIKSLVDMDEYHQKQKKRLEYVALKSLKCIFEASSESEKTFYVNKIADIKLQFGKEQAQSETKALLKTFMIDAFMFELGQIPNNIQTQLQQIIKLSQTMESKHIQKLFKQLNPQILAHKDFNNTNIKLGQTQKKQIIEQNYFKMKCHKPPERVQQYVKNYQLKCQKCKQYSAGVWQCLICNLVRCQHCQTIGKHSSESHIGSCIFLQLINANFLLIYKEILIKQYGIYHNQFNQCWRRSLKFEGFVLKDSTVDQFYKSLILNEVPNLANRQKLGTILRTLNGEAEQDW